MKLIFFLLINVKDLFRVILSFLMCVVRHAQTIQNNKFALSPQRLKKEVSKKLMFCMQISMMVKDPQSSKFAMSVQNFEKEFRDEVEFLHAHKH